jgi:hypothetical protein
MRLEDTLADLEEQLATGSYKTPNKRITVLTKQQADLQAMVEMKRRSVRAKIESAKPKNLGAEIAREAIGTFRWTQLGSDFGALFRQGLYGLARPAAFVRSAGKGIKSAVSEAEFAKAMLAIENRRVDGQLMDPVRRKAGLSLTNTITTQEEGFISKWLSKVPIVGRPLERGQSAFLNALRSDIFDTFYTKLPGATEEELAARARYINTATGRGNIQKVPALLEALMTSPRYTASRWEMLEAPLRYGIGALKGNKGAMANLQDLGVAAGGIIAALKIAEAAGAEIYWDPTDTDFMKIRVGDTVYDPTAGVAAPLRLAARLLALSGLPEFGSGKNTYDYNMVAESARTLSNTLNPGVRTPLELAMQQGLGGFALDEGEQGAMALAPLIVQGAIESWGKDSGAKTAAGIGTEFLGVGSNRYERKGNPWREKMETEAKSIKRP